MIKELLLDNQTIKYQITYKNNKNTYFHFKSDGYIQINASKKQGEKKILAFIEKNKESFIRKYLESLKNEVNNQSYYLKGIEYIKLKDNTSSELAFNITLHTVTEPDIAKEKIDAMYKKMEKKIMLSALDKLKEKYLENGLIDLKSITFKTRYMKTRFGSCVPSKNNININLYLTRYEDKYLQYVFLHEISHLVHHNHSKEFYKLLSALCPNYKQLKKELNNKFRYR